ncbi:MAG TPA: Rrf2 family transcriptional regulator [Chloroflexi bacterium]|jgi:Rrf2 family protein|nr:Rrf2 family transcriptional regulator [Chloroflexota bacterium]
MRLGTKVRYGTRALLELALRPQHEMTSLKEIARSQEVSQKYLEHLFSALQVAGLVRSARGPRGGYTLARPAGEITVREIYEVLEGLDDFAPCTSGPEVCNRYDICVTHELWERMHEAAMRVLDETTIEDLARAAQQKQVASARMYHI